MSFLRGVYILDNISKQVSTCHMWISSIKKAKVESMAREWCVGEKGSVLDKGIRGHLLLMR